MINVLWLHSDHSGCGIYRCYVPARSLQDGGKFDNHFLLHKATPQQGFGDLGDMQIVVFQRAVGTLFLAWMKECQRRGIKTVFEMDDDLFHVSQHNPAGTFWNNKNVQRILRQQLDLADHIVVSTPPLRDVVLLETKRREVSTCYNHLHPEIWGPQVYAGQPRYTNISASRPLQVVGWQGSNTHDHDFAQAVPALARVIKERDDVIVRFFGNVPLSIRGHIPESRFQWSRGVEFHMYPATLHYVNFDIGLAPITDSKFNRAKSNLKWLEYSALGVPTIASRVYPYARSIDDGQTGLIATTTEEWYDALVTLLDDVTLRKRIGERARDHAWKQWGVTRALAWDQLFSTLVGDHGQLARPQLPEFSGAGAFLHKVE